MCAAPLDSWGSRAEVLRRAPAGLRETDDADSLAVAEAFLREGMVAPERFQEALQLAQQWKMPLGQVLMARGDIRAQEYYRALAGRLNRPFVNLVEQPPSAELLEAHR